MLGKKSCKSSREFIRNMYSIFELANATYGFYEIYIIITVSKFSIDIHKSASRIVKGKITGHENINSCSL